MSHSISIPISEELRLVLEDGEKLREIMRKAYAEALREWAEQLDREIAGGEAPDRIRPQPRRPAE